MKKRKSKNHREAVGDILADEGAAAQVVALWRIAEGDFAEARKLGMVDCDFAEYERRIDDAQRQALASGHRVLFSHASPGDVRRALAAENLPMNPATMAMVHGLFAIAEMEAKLENQDDEEKN